MSGRQMPARFGPMLRPARLNILHSTSKFLFASVGLWARHSIRAAKKGRQPPHTNLWSAKDMVLGPFAMN